MTTATKLVTAEEFWLLPDNGGRRSLVRGELEETMPPGLRHAFTAAIFCQRLARWAEEGKAGMVGVEGGFILARDPDIVRAPDVFFVRRDRVEGGDITEKFGAFAPDLAIEVVSPSETAQEVREKVSDFLTAGTALVWVAYPKSREVVAHTPDGLARTHRSDDILTTPDVLPGFSCPVAALFP